MPLPMQNILAAIFISLGLNPLSAPYQHPVPLTPIAPIQQQTPVEKPKPVVEPIQPAPPPVAPPIPPPAVCDEATQWVRADNGQCLDKPQPAYTPKPAYTQPAKPVYTPRPHHPGNTYEWGNCTWYAKNRRSDLPNNLGNANTWYARAQAQGYAVGQSPAVGAVGVSYGGYYGHVVIVEAVLNDGQIRISEANYQGLGVISERVTSASAFDYIY